MMANEEQWDLDTDEIRSIDSEELYETRPNRWKGSKATWHVYTQEERLIYKSLEEIRNRDLSVHLYNAFALKNRETRAGAAEPDAEDADRPLEEIVDSSDWRPPNPWTAWPMNTQTVPGDDFLKQTHDEDDEFTIRSNAPQMPSTALEDELTATILRQAKERFYQRQEKYRRKEAAAQHVAAATSQSAATMSGVTSDDEDDVKPPADDETQTESSEKTPQTQRTKTYEAVVSANDDLSADLLRPSVRHILTVMDNTLTTLHNARLAGLSYMTDSSASATDLSDAEGSDSAVSRRSRSRTPSRKGGKLSRSRSQAPRTPEPRTPEPERSASGKRGKGRPRKVQTPLPGETEREMVIRIARAQKKKIPAASDAEDSNANMDNIAAIHENDADDEDMSPEKRRPTPKSPARSPRKKRDLPPEARMEARTKAREAMLGNWGLRDWSDVLGAASISGFKPEVVARAAQRCADLFGQGMDMQTLVEGPASKRSKPQRTRYIPGMRRHRAVSLSSSEDEGDCVDARGRKRRARSRGRESVAPSDSEARAGSRRRSVSRSSSVGLFFCPVAGCERAAEGFGRKANLQRHVARVHPGQAVDVDDVESENEMFGAVHVDGFLKPIRARKGWRAEDTGMRKRKRHYRGRRLQSGDEGSVGGEESFWDSS
ncbi:hypothetical protein CGCSCA4_v011215 [Colletotrichum siamense]|uniref:RNA polymerase I specific transcription initiation factor n=1 Tax=Colletotrichum siamense TaxID=690259 RepID=A0A9P5ELS2_COLSI|nr:hypothetical protein CGCSCA4_v011215 [Colletotrichum siamense]KAF4853185.1 hypothetical protein CGCSCA2_v010002 [Colletotrichum siamense]